MGLLSGIMCASVVGVYVVDSARNHVIAHR